VDWVQVHAGVIASARCSRNPNTLKAVLRAVRKGTETLNNDREACIKIVAREMKIDEGLAREIMTYNVYSMEMNSNIVRGMNDFVDFSTRSTVSSRSSRRAVFYTKILEEVDRAREVEVEDRRQVAVRPAVPATSLRSRR